MRGIHLGGSTVTLPGGGTPPGLATGISFVIIDDIIYFTDHAASVAYEAPVTFVGPTSLPSGIVTASADTLLFHYQGGVWQSPATVVSGSTLTPGSSVIVNDTYFICIAGSTHSMPVTRSLAVPGAQPSGEMSLVTIDDVEYVRVVFPDGEVRYEEMHETPAPDAEGVSGGNVATDTIWDAAGDLAVGSGPDTAARLPLGTALQVLRVNVAGTNLEWAAAAAGGVAVGDSPTWTGRHIFGVSGAASAPAVSLTGIPFVGGTATTTKPLALLEPTGTTSTGWSTLGTILGANAPAGFAGNLIDAQVEGVSKFKVSSTGIASVSDGTSAAPSVSFSSNPDSGLYSPGGAFLGLTAGGTDIMVLFAPAIRINSSTILSWSSGAPAATLWDTSLARLGPANLRLGHSPTATPLAQTLTIGEASRPGTDSNVMGGSAIIQSGLGTGNAEATRIYFQTPNSAVAGSGAQTYVERLQLSTYGSIFNGPVTCGDAFMGAISMNNNVQFYGPASGQIRLSNIAGTDFSRLMLGGTTASFPAIKRSGAAIDFRLADDSADAAITAGAATFTGPITATGGIVGNTGIIGFTASDTAGVSTGKTKGFVVCPYAATISGWSIVVDAGTATVKCWKIASGTAKPTNANSINTAGVAISSNTAVISTTLTDFTTLAVAANDIFAFDISVVSGVTELTFQLKLIKS